MWSRQRTFGRDLRRLNDVVAATPLAGRYWVFGGLLLGWARERAVLGHDVGDADFCFLREDLAAFHIAARALLGAGFAPLYRFDNNAGHPTEYTFTRHGSKFEFFVADRVGDRVRYHVYCGARGERAPTQALGELADQPLETFRFLRRTWSKHADHDAELTRHYGDWRTAAPDWFYMDDLAIVAQEPWLVDDFGWSGEL